jgi:uncharacterized protein (TIGR00297 family)
MNAPSRSEAGRKLAHIAAGSGALLLRYISWWEALVVVGLALAFNLYGLPRIAGGALMREQELTHRFTSGVVLYPLSILLLILIFPARLDIVAACWGILAVGDGMATIAGRGLGGMRIPWNREKSVTGSIAFAACGGAAGAFLCWWCRTSVVPPPYAWFLLGAPFLAAGIAALVETIPVRLDDNVLVSFSSAGVLWSASLVSEDLAAAAWSSTLPMLPLALLVNVAASSAGAALRTVSISGAICGALIGTIIFLATGWPGWLLLMLTFGSAVVSSRVGLRRKTRLGIAEEREGRRAAGNAIANTGVATAAAMLAVLSYAREPALIAFVAALAAGGSDTVASEIGKAFGRRARILTTWRDVPPGTPGGLSLQGSAAGLLAASCLAAVAAVTGLIPTGAVIGVIGGVVSGSLAESLMGATLEPAGVLNNDILNFLNTAIAALVAVFIATA